MSLPDESKAEGPIIDHCMRETYARVVRLPDSGQCARDNLVHCTVHGVVLL